MKTSGRKAKKAPKTKRVGVQRRGSGPCGFGWVTRDNPRWDDWGAWSSRVLVMTHSGSPMVVYVPENGLPEYEHQDEFADPDEWSAWSEIPRVQNDPDQATASKKLP